MLLSAETLLEEKRMPIRAKYVHTNLIARDWKRLVRFYREVFGCEPKGPERDLSAAWLDRVNSVPNARLRGVHLRLPGYGDDAPTLEIFSYDQLIERFRNRKHPDWTMASKVIETLMRTQKPTDVSELRGWARKVGRFLLKGPAAETG